ncbi:enoyl-CoA hydratase/isomerase family protein [Pseudalkalibacillus decolorationis]|uniref:enoyl-CoA hydratase/isomerase family protein n=1 Tax=Pseudalkalibacillus decolorationis TaxID=163879 RepID=UPI002148B314|nr:enoyl-CoA hydratase-related protein [Pseudalkalibacillus decolorationis]
MVIQNLDVVIENNLAYVKINRPEVRNALNKETLDELTIVLERLESDEEVKCVILTGEGEKSFAAGADIGQLENKTMHDALKAGGMQQVYDYIEGYKKPTIAMINGYALGGGCELAMACDVRIASRTAKMGLPELNLSIIPGAGGTQRLTRLVGKGKALELILTGKIISSEEAANIGLISEVVESSQLKEKTVEVAQQIISKGPLAVMLAKLAVNVGAETDMKTALIIEKLSQAILFSSEDKQEGTRAFLEKRKPAFQGK